MAPSYLDSIHYVDQSIGKYIEALPQGTIVVIYGDHGAHADGESLGYKNAEYEGVALVPFLIHQVGGDLSSLQKTRGAELATSGELTLLDMVLFIYDVVGRQQSSL